MLTTRRRWIGRGLVWGIIAAPIVGWGAYAGVAWLGYGHSRQASSHDALIARYMSSYDISEVHQTRVAAPASVTARIVNEMDLQRSRTIRAILRGRELMLGGASTPRPRNYPLECELVALGWGVLKEVPGREIVFGAITQPWQPNVIFRSLAPRSFAAFDSAGYVKIVVTLVVDSVGPGESIFRTETRVQTTDPVARAKFRRYWSIFSPGILLIRSEALRLVRQEAARAAGVSTR
jgi:hypothetical protein